MPIINLPLINLGNRVEKQIQRAVGLSTLLANKHPKKTLRRRLYDNIQPVDYEGAPLRFLDGISNIKNYRDPYNESRDKIWAEYLQIPVKDRHDNKYSLIKSNYKPDKYEEGATYYKAPSVNYYGTDYDARVESGAMERALIREGSQLLPNTHKLSTILGSDLGTHTLAKKHDNRGTYVSYYDLWDLAPIGGHGSDQSFGIGKPVRLYDRYYLDDVMGLPDSAIKGGIWLPEIGIIYNKRTKKSKRYWGHE